LLRAQGVDQGSIVCLFAGTLGRTYDLAPVITAARQLAANPVQRFHFLICGDGERAAHWRSLANGLPNVCFTGWLDQDRMRAALAAADLGLAAYAEGAPQGLPNKVIEYLAAGLPVISSLAGETAQLLAREHCGVTYQAANSSSFQDALLAMVSPEERRPLGENARRTFEAEFSAETVYSAMADHLESIASAGLRDATSNTSRDAGIAGAKAL
jgi:glycosyltransferase involved in cell wall biosynthesis